MPSRHALTVSLTPELARFVAEEVGSGRYGSASEVMRAGLRLLSGPGSSAGMAVGAETLAETLNVPRRVGARAVRAAQRAEGSRG